MMQRRIKKRMRYFLESIKGYQDFHFEMYDHDLICEINLKKLVKILMMKLFNVAEYYSKNY